MNYEAVKEAAASGKVLTLAEFKALDIDPIGPSSPKQSYADVELVGKVVLSGRSSFTIVYEQ